MQCMQVMTLCPLLVMLYVTSSFVYPLQGNRLDDIDDVCYRVAGLPQQFFTTIQLGLIQFRHQTQFEVD